MADCEKCGDVIPKQLYLSWSQLRHHSECKQKSYLMRTGQKDPATNIRVFFPGTVVDRVMRDYLMLGEPAAGFMASRVKDKMDEEEQNCKDTGDGIAKWKSRADRIEVAEFCVELVKRLEPILADLVLPHQYEPSKRFKVPVSIPYLDGTRTSVMLVGEYDILLKYASPHDLSPRPWEIWDLKATKNDQYWRSTIGQLIFYDLCNYLMFRQYTARVGLIQPMCKQQTVAIEITDQQRVEMMQRIIGMAHSIWKTEAFPNSEVFNIETEIRPDTKYCFMCAVKKSCPRFQPTGIGNVMNLGIGNDDLLNMAPQIPVTQVPIVPAFGVGDLLNELNIDP